MRLTTKSAGKDKTRLFIVFDSYLTELSRTEDVSEHDGILLWNLTPSNYEEAVALVPSLQKANKEKVERYIEFLNEKRGALKM